jgi:nucleotide-binding universal stress UspA family protein
VDATASVQPAVDRAAQIARACGAGLRIVDVVSASVDARRSLSPDLENELMTRRRQQLARIAYSVRDVPADLDLLSGPPADALIEDVGRFGHDLLVRAHTRDLVARGPKAFAAVDAELFRRCPCPVWAVGPGPAPPSPKIVCAVDASATDRVKEALSKRLVEVGQFFARVQGGSLILLNAWRPLAEEHVYSHATDDAFAAHLDNTRNGAKDRLARFAESFGTRLAGVQLELRRGALENVIGEFVVAEGVDLVVVGTLGRTGLTRRLVGNTAERVLQRVPCSVVAVKPDGFASKSRA